MAQTGNALLDVLSEPLQRRILQVARPFDIPIGTELFAPGEKSHHVYFLTSGMASQVVTMADDGSVEIGMIGAEGLVGASALLGPALNTMSCFMQASGEGLRFRMNDIRAIFEDSAELRSYVLQHIQLQIYAMSRASACNALHEAEQRLARWLLTASDVSKTDAMDLTQGFLAQMMGIQRTTVALVAGKLRKRGLIAYSRGTVRICDREGLTRAACDCYSVTSRMLAELYSTTYNSENV